MQLANISNSIEVQKGEPTVHSEHPGLNASACGSDRSQVIDPDTRDSESKRLAK